MKNKLEDFYDKSPTLIMFHHFQAKDTNGSSVDGMGFMMTGDEPELDQEEEAVWSDQDKAVIHPALGLANACKACVKVSHEVCLSLSYFCDNIYTSLIISECHSPNNNYYYYFLIYFFIGGGGLYIPSRDSLKEKLVHAIC